ncbi:pilus assembly protein N-terminal domain-containing protein [Lichenihabitans sp. Uapishka_5]|uniref:pilus assembly protein N-terminal domain-containing protein n=1 Tax=Lichenihabitans sp. Uapishka_5 TaxID=3037302 RepID=UPI0029E803C6|nr:pilus assembly protein N-terminal domain-containing protein [Lichenihabitans sp. Uapishka_5]MDX7952761.1 pilus assembly protein N-terminal domain-containing protein [Lichenihabitans sp. Uapishka_5]
MTRSFSPVVLAICCLALPIGPALADPAPDHVVVQLDKAKLVKVPAHVETVVIGNPSIADVTMMKRNGLMVVTGKGFGETNVIFVDTNGQALSEAVVTVVSGAAMVTVQRGMDRESYSCAPRCQPTVALGDATKFLTDASSQITSRNTLVTPVQH